MLVSSGLGAAILTLIFGLASTGCSPGPPRHGTSLLLLVGTNQPETGADQERVVAEARQVLHRRLGNAGIGHAFFQATNEGQLLIRLRSLTESETASVRKLIEKPGLLELRTVHPESEELIKDEIIAPGYEVLRSTQLSPQPDGSKTSKSFLVSRTPATGMIGGKKLAMTGKYLKQAFAARDQVTHLPQINFEFDADGAEIFRQITRNLSPKGGKFYHLAIVLDGVLYSAPRVMGEIPAGRGQITGAFTVAEATELANVMEHPLPAPVRVVEAREY